MKSLNMKDDLDVCLEKSSQFLFAQGFERVSDFRKLIDTVIIQDSVEDFTNEIAKIPVEKRHDYLQMPFAQAVIKCKYKKQVLWYVLFPSPEEEGSYTIVIYLLHNGVPCIGAMIERCSPALHLFDDEALPSFQYSRIKTYLDVLATFPEAVKTLPLGAYNCFNQMMNELKSQKDNENNVYYIVNQQMTQYLTLLGRCLIYINYEIEKEYNIKQELLEKRKAIPSIFPGKVPKKPKSTAYTNRKKGHIFIGGLDIQKCEDSTLTRTKILERKCHCSCWSVRGHVRHLKSGKTIWIKSFNKGPERLQGTIIPKTYTVT